MAASLRRGPTEFSGASDSAKNEEAGLERYEEGTNILALKQDRFNKTYLQVADLKMVDETGLEIAGYPHAAMAFILHAQGITLRSHKQSLL